MNLNKTLCVLNAMQADQIIGHYAIGGAVAAFLYIEPATTFDLDTFIFLNPTPSGLLTLEPIYTHLRNLGYNAKREMVEIEGWPVQFLAPGTPVTIEALERASPVEIEGVQTHVFTQEHLMAVCLETNRPKDLARLVQFVQKRSFDEVALDDILKRHRLFSKWEQFQQLFFEKL